MLLVDNASTDGTPELVRRHLPWVEVVELPENRAAVARNVGVERARTPYVAFADDDSWWAPGALDRAADLFDRHPRLAVVAGAVLVGDAETLDPTSALMQRSPLPPEPDLPGTPVLGFIACGAVVRREAFLAVGGFDDVVEIFGEEERVALDLAATGWGQAYVAHVVAHHHPSPSRQSALAREARVTRNRLLTAVMRRPWPVVGREVSAALRSRGGRRGVLDAVPRLPLAIRRRHVVPASVEARLCLLEAPG